MLRLPRFEYVAARSVGEAVDALAAGPDDTMLLAGGTDVLPNMKRRQQTPRVLVGISRAPDLKQVDVGDRLVLGAGLTLAELLRVAPIRQHYTGLWQAAAQIATP